MSNRSNFTTSFRLIAICCFLIASAALVGKVVRSFVMAKHQIVYYPKDKLGKDLDLAIAVTDSWREQWDKTGLFTVEDLIRIREDSGFYPQERKKDENYVSSKEGLDLLIKHLEITDTRTNKWAKDPEAYWVSKQGQNRVLSAIEDRLDDIAFANVMLLFMFAFLLYLRWVGIDSDLEELRQSLPTFSRKAGTIVFVLVSFPLFAAIPQALHLFGGDYGPIHGSFRTLMYIREITYTQWLDGVIWIFASFLFLATLTRQFVSIRELRAVATCDALINHCNWLAYFPSYFALGSLAGWVALVNSSPGGMNFHPVPGTTIIYLFGIYLCFVGSGLIALIGGGFGRHRRIPSHIRVVYGDIENLKDGFKPFRLEARGDDLTKISGIGTQTEKALQRHGIRTYRQILELDNETAAKIENSEKRLKGRIDLEKWKSEAIRHIT